LEKNLPRLFSVHARTKKASKINENRLALPDPHPCGAAGFPYALFFLGAENC
jgi:hypothetical protein